MQNKYVAGFISGLIATMIISVVVLIEVKMRFISVLDIGKNISLILSTEGLGAKGWLIHFILGAVVWGLLFAAVENSMHLSYWIEGLIFSIIIWFLMMVTYMPLMGAGFFGINMGISALVGTLLLHMSYGVLLGLIYGAIIYKRMVLRKSF